MNLYYDCHKYDAGICSGENAADFDTYKVSFMYLLSESIFFFFKLELNSHEKSPPKSYILLGLEL